eukprot:GCRY01005142.1.p2 GENE.GCRY01005142.1~~GCRY01005142.1.p2  ORF type:complete len:150 (+),score=20.15 GCRY01005142.1:1022-1471(+)
MHLFLKTLSLDASLLFDGDECAQLYNQVYTQGENICDQLMTITTKVTFAQSVCDSFVEKVVEHCINHVATTKKGRDVKTMLERMSEQLRKNVAPVCEMLNSHIVPIQTAYLNLVEKAELRASRGQKRFSSLILQHIHRALNANPWGRVY